MATGSFDTGREIVGEGLSREVARELRPKASVELARICGKGREYSLQREQNVLGLKEGGRWHIPESRGHHSPQGISGVRTGPRKALAVSEPVVYRG